MESRASSDTDPRGPEAAARPALDTPRSEAAVRNVRRSLRHQGVTEPIANRLQALERDRHYRVVSQEGQPVVAHIIPYYFGRHAGGLEAAMPNIFRFLNLFAGQTAVNRLNNYLMLPGVVGGRPRINRLENLTCLTATNHRLFGRGSFVLEPPPVMEGTRGKSEACFSRWEVVTLTREIQNGI